MKYIDSKNAPKSITGKNWDAKMVNDLTFLDYYNRLKEYAINMFEWVNLPTTIDPRYLELILFEKGLICFFKDNNLDEHLCLQCVATGPFNVYNEPKRRHIYTASGYQANKTIKNSVLIYNNYLRQPTELTINLYARRLTEIERTIDINVKSQKTPVIVTCSESQRLTLKNLISQYDGNEIFIYGDKELNLDGIKAIKTDAPYVGNELNILKHQLWNECMTFLGISNANQDKKERLVTDEISSNDEQIEQSRFSMLNARKLACKRINDMFGLNVDVKFRNGNKVQGNENDMKNEPEQVGDKNE